MLKHVRLVGSQISSHLSTLAGLRIRIFNEYPYLYVGSEESEREYLKVYEECPDAMVILAYDDSQVVGALTTIPFEFEHADIKLPLIQKGFDLSRIFYCGEILLLPEYRGKGHGGRLFSEVDNRIRELGLDRFDIACLCTVKRPDNHPWRPADYRSLNSFWEKYGYIRQPDLIGTFTWKDVHEISESPKPMEFWFKPTDEITK